MLTHSPLSARVDSPSKALRSPFKDAGELKRAVLSGELSFESLRSPKKADLWDQAVDMDLDDLSLLPASIRTSVSSSYTPLAQQHLLNRQQQLQQQQQRGQHGLIPGLQSSPNKVSPVKKIRCDLMEDTPRKPMGDVSNLLTSPVKRAVRPYGKDKEHIEVRKSETTAKSVIPRFFFPKGKAAPTSSATATINSEAQDILATVRPLFKDAAIDEEHFVFVIKRCDLPRFITGATFRSIDKACEGAITFDEFSRFWTALTRESTDVVSHVYHIMKERAHSYISPSDFEPVVFDVLFNHPGLTFLAECPQFQDKYGQHFFFFFSFFFFFLSFFLFFSSSTTILTCFLVLPPHAQSCPLF